MQRMETFGNLGQRGGWRQVEDERPDLGPQKMVGAGRAERGQGRVLAPGQEIQHHRAVGEVPHLRVVGGGQPAEHGGQGRCPLAAPRAGQRLKVKNHIAERLRAPTGVQVLLGRGDDLQGASLAFIAGIAPGRDPVPAENDPHGLRGATAELGDVQAELEARAPPRDPADPVAEAVTGQRRPIGCGREGDPRVGVQVVDMRRLDEPVHGGVDGWRRPTLC